MKDDATSDRLDMAGVKIKQALEKLKAITPNYKLEKFEEEICRINSERLMLRYEQFNYRMDDINADTILMGLLQMAISFFWIYAALVL